MKGFAGAEYMEDGMACLEKECDILIPAALEGQITKKNAKRIQCKLIIEAANGPVTFNADQILNEMGVVVLPDMYVNAGGVTVSYFEWIKNLSHIRFGRMGRRQEERQGKLIVEALEMVSGKEIPEEMSNAISKGADEIALVRSGLDDTMRLAYQEIRSGFHEDPKIKDFRTAAFVIALRKIAQTYLDMGI